MRNNHLVRKLFVIVLLGINLQACGSIGRMVQGTLTFTPTVTLAPSLTPTSTSTLTPTMTPSPTVTPNLAATQQYQEFFTIVQKFYDAGIIPNLNGSYQVMDDYTDQSIDAGTYRWKLYDDGVVNFIARADIKLETAPAPASQSGCGFVFGVIDDSNHEFAFLQRNGSASYGLGGRPFTTKYYDQLQNPAEFTITLVVYKDVIRVIINDKEVIKMELDLNREIKTAWGPALLAGSTQEFGTRCTFKNIELWEIGD
ncbi:MAG: hypothetical protein ACM33V_10555 [Chloroflexota bacterium]|nr:hypothetical protein [Anaerolineales bacterium]